MESNVEQDAELRPFALTGNFFPKIVVRHVVRHDIHKRWYDDNGVLNIGIIDFLLDDEQVQYGSKKYVCWYMMRIRQKTNFLILQL